jgi:hypothetical protein
MPPYRHCNLEKTGKKKEKKKKVFRMMMTTDLSIFDHKV